MTKKVKLMLCTFALLFVFLGVNATAQSNSIIPDDTCAPPCWMGLIPGESKAQDVEQFITDYLLDDVDVFGEFDEEGQYLIMGVYEFVITPNEETSIYVEIEIRNTYVDTIVLHPTFHQFSDYITLNQLIAQLGQPSRIHSYPGGAMFGDEFYLNLIYLQTRLRIKLSYNPAPLSTDCTLHTIGDLLVIDSLIYYSEDTAYTLATYPGTDEPQPILSALYLGEGLVSPQIWQEVMDGEREENCRFIPYEENDIRTVPIIYTEPDEPSSLFLEDTCAPPCWFGLTVGESTSEAVLNFIQNSTMSFREWRVDTESNFDNQTGFMISGLYISQWVFFDREYPINTGAVLAIEDGTLVRITSQSNQVILLYEVLDRLGTPDYIAIDWSDTMHAFLEVRYSDLQLHVNFRSIWSGCDISRMSNNFWVDWVQYYAPVTQQQIDVSTYSMTEVPIEIWNQWINGESDGSCRTIWNDLLNQ